VVVVDDVALYGRIYVRVRQRTHKRAHHRRKPPWAT